MCNLVSLSRDHIKYVMLLLYSLTMSYVDLCLYEDYVGDYVIGMMFILFPLMLMCYVDLPFETLS